MIQPFIKNKHNKSKVKDKNKIFRKKNNIKHCLKKVTVILDNYLFTIFKLHFSQVTLSKACLQYLLCKLNKVFKMSGVNELNQDLVTYN